VASAATPTPLGEIPLPEYHGKGRVTVLLLGLDLREGGRNQPTRSDTMILVTVDPATKKAGMLSIPRDLWVAIPGHGENKINTAHYFGEEDKPGGGPELARKTVELNFGVHVQYWARVDFYGFEQLIDAVGGVTVDAYRAIKDDMYPAENSGIRRVYIPTGLQHLTGAEALTFARSRHSENDFGRGVRQRQVLLAARQRLLQPSVIPKIPQIIGIASGSVDTNVPLTDYLPLLNLARQVDTSDIVSRSIDYSMTIDLHNDGTVLLPKREAVRAVLAEVFNVQPTPTPAPTPRPTSTPTPSPTARPVTPTVVPVNTPTAPTTVNVLNGTDRNLLAAGWAERLRAAGYAIGQIKQADRFYQQTTILDHTGREGAARALIQALGLADAVVERALPAENGADLSAILGRDVRAP
jgi:LCP family protein required for cell wall assembly